MFSQVDGLIYELVYFYTLASSQISHSEFRAYSSQLLIRHSISLINCRLDITSFVASVRQSFVTAATMAAAIMNNTSYFEAAQAYEIGAVFADPATPSPDSATARVKEQVTAFPWMAESSTIVSQLGYSADVSAKLVNDMKRAQARQAVQQAAAQAGLELTGGTDD